jgi:hypothetical protein
MRTLRLKVKPGARDESLVELADGSWVACVKAPPVDGKANAAVIALVARGHRKQAPKPSDPELQALPGSKRKLVRGLAALLRIADALDRTHFGVVKSLNVEKAAGRILIEVDAGAENAELELWAAERRIDLLSRLLDRPVVLRAARTARPRSNVRRAS